MDRRLKILGLTISLLIVSSCIDNNVSIEKREAIGIWYCDDCLLVLLEDSTFVANNIYDVKIFLGKDTISKGQHNVIVDKFQTAGIIGVWRLLSAHNDNSHIELTFQPYLNDSLTVKTKRIDVIRNYICDIAILDEMLKVSYSRDPNQIIFLSKLTGPYETDSFYDNYINIFH